MRFSNPSTYGCAVRTCSASSPGGPGRVARTDGSWQGFGLEQAIRFLPFGGGRVAYSLVGSGPTLLLDLGRAHDLEAFWRNPSYRQLVQRLGRRFTVVRWDRPGFGMSDREAPDFSLGAELSLLDHLVARLGPDDVRILAADDAGPVMVQFAARRPARVSHLALFGTAAEGRALLSFLPPRALSVLGRSDTQLLHGLVA